MFNRISNLVRGFLSLFISGIEKQAPEALLEAEKENLRKSIANYNDGLAAHAGLCERLMSQVKTLEKEEQTLRAKTAANLRAGNTDAAGQLALQLQTTNRELVENRQQLEQAEVTYKNLLRAREVAVREAQSKIDSLKSGLNDLKIKRATAELAEMASGMITKIGGSGDTLGRLEEMVDEERSKAAGRARLAKDSIDTSGIDLKESEQKALADQALADFAAREGLTLDTPTTPDATAAAPPVKTMGPE